MWSPWSVCCTVEQPVEEVLVESSICDLHHDGQAKTCSSSSSSKQIGSDKVEEPSFPRRLSISTCGSELSDQAERTSEFSSEMTMSDVGSSSSGEAMTNTLPSWKRRPGRPVFEDARPEEAETPSETSTSKSIKFTVELNKSLDEREKIGLSTASLAGKLGGIVVQRVNPSLVEKWNLWNPDRAIREGDRIVEVNGQQGDADLLWALVAVHDRLSLVVQRELLDFSL